MPRNAKLARLALTSVIVSAVVNPQQADAKKFSQWASTIYNGARQIQQFRNSHSGSGGGGEPLQHPQSSYEAGSSGAPGSNYYNISPDTMRNPLKHQEVPQPAYTPPPTPEPSFSPSYSSRSAYHTGAGSSPDYPGGRMPNYIQAHAKIHAHVAPKHIERVPEKTAVVAAKKPAAAEDSLKVETLKPATAFDTSWVTHAVDRIETRLRAPQG